MSFSLVEKQRGSWKIATGQIRMTIECLCHRELMAVFNLGNERSRIVYESNGIISAGCLRGSFPSGF
jgi:hypothetical protein